MRRLLSILPLLFFFNACGKTAKTYNLTPAQLELFCYLPENTENIFYADPDNLNLKSNYSVSAQFGSKKINESALGSSSSGNTYLLSSAPKGTAALNILQQKNSKPGKIFEKMNISRQGRLIRLHPVIGDNELYELKQITRS